VQELEDCLEEGELVLGVCEDVLLEDGGVQLGDEFGEDVVVLDDAAVVAFLAPDALLYLIVDLLYQ
jgi:hypothetical protein